VASVILAALVARQALQTAALAARGPTALVAAVAVAMLAVRRRALVVWAALVLNIQSPQAALLVPAAAVAAAAARLAAEAPAVWAAQPVFMVAAAVALAALVSLAETAALALKASLSLPTMPPPMSALPGMPEPALLAPSPFFWSRTFLSRASPEQPMLVQ